MEEETEDQPINPRVFQPTRATRNNPLGQDPEWVNRR